MLSHQFLLADPHLKNKTTQGLRGAGSSFDGCWMCFSKAGVDCWYKYPADVKSRYNTPVSAKFEFGGRKSFGNELLLWRLRQIMCIGLSIPPIRIYIAQASLEGIMQEDRC